MKRLSIFILIFIVIACNTGTQTTEISIRDLAGGKDVKKSGKLLISQPNGFIKIIGKSPVDNSTLVISVHGYESEGYEWIDALNKFSEEYSNLYFYRYDWNKCPEEVGKNLASSIDSLLSINKNIDNIKIYGHSYGGLVVTFCAGNLNNGITTEVHTIASPLAGFPLILDSCDLLYDKQNIIQYPEWNANITHHQWKTQKDQDGAFQYLDSDPQEINIRNSTVTVLPDSMDGHRLGHNWSVTWVINKLLTE